MQTPFEGARYYESSQKKKGVILLHAYTGSPRDVNLLARKLQNQGMNVLCPLFKGHDSMNIEDIFTGNPKIWQDETSQWIQWMTTQGFEELYIFGLSMGGIFATWALCQTDFELKAGGVFNSPVTSKRDINITQPFLAFARFIYNKQHPGCFDQVKDNILNQHLFQMQALEDFKENFQSDLAELTGAFYIGQSLQDELIDPNGARDLEESLVSAKTTMKWYPNNSHVITVNRDRQDFENDVIEFINQA